MIAPDRVGVSRGTRLALAAAAGLTLAAGVVSAAQRGGHPPLAGAAIAFGVAVLAVFGLPSISLRLTARLLVLVGGGLLVRYGLLAGSLLDGGQGQGLVAWVVGTVAVLVLTDGLGSATGRDRQPWAVTARSAALVSVALILLMAVLAPLALHHLGGSSSPGDGPRLDQAAGQDTPLRASDSLDMTRRPDLSDAVVLTIESPEAAFWRGQTFDVWDGRTWRRSDARLAPVLPGSGVLPADDDLAAVDGAEVRQRIRVEAPYADLLVAQASAARVTAGRTVLQARDGTLTTGAEPMGRGATYTVTSRRFALTAAMLRGADQGSIPAEVATRYAAPPATTERVRAAARSATRRATTTYDRILALERWMGDRTRYSIDAPLSPAGVDVVDHFLFTSRAGWCEQVASSLVVMARSLGIPARLATGYVPDERDRITGSYVVRERDAHAWTEVWFPRYGWVAFDPTADLALAGQTSAAPTVGEWLLEHALEVLLVLAALALLAGPVARRVRRRLAARRARPTSVSWAATADRRLDRLGAAVERPRAAAESATAYAAALAPRYGRPDLADVGVVVDRALCAPDEPPPEVTLALDRLLDEIEAAGTDGLAVPAR